MAEPVEDPVIKAIAEINDQKICCNAESLHTTPSSSCSERNKLFISNIDGMVFKKYSSIENSFQKAFVHNIIAQGFAGETFVVQEKVHGANFSFITDGKTLQCGKRTGLLNDDEDFYNWQSICDQYKKSVSALLQELQVQDKSIDNITIYGELCGGGYPHHDFPVDKNKSLVQRGIYYSPDYIFYAYDILVNGDYFLDVDTTNRWLEKFGFLYAQSLFEGSLNDCLQYPNAFPSTIPARLGLPMLQGNICEGVVIRPKKPLFFHNGSRIILKNKNENWSENNNTVDHKILKEIFADDIELTPEMKQLQNALLSYVSENRLANVISKIGIDKARRQTGKVLGLFSKDVLEDFAKSDAGKQLETLPKKDQKAVTRVLNGYAKNMVMDYLMKQDANSNL